jgi:nuclear pore complex protein Nup93
LFGTLGASTSQPASQTGSTSLFARSQPSELSGQTQTQAQNAQSTVAPAVKSQTAYFDQMLERGKKRNNQENGNLGDLPRLQLGLGDIARKVRNLGTGGPSADQAKPNDTRAYVCKF